jgi:hypothetical protein
MMIIIDIIVRSLAHQRTKTNYNLHLEIKNHIKN